MELHCTLVSPDARNAALGRTRREIVVDAAERTSGADIAEALEREYGTQGCTVAGVPLAALTVGIPPLVNGSVLVANGTGRIGRSIPSPLSLVVHTGPAAGTVVPLGRGTLRLGRAPGGPGRSVSLPDPELSRDHALIEVTDAAVVLSDAGSANGVWLEGRRIRRAPVTAGQLIRLGSSTCTLVFTVEEPPVDAQAGTGPPPPLRVTRHTPPSRRAAMITMAVLPLAVGVAMALATGMWMFLAFTAVSAVSVLIPVVEGRAARRDFERRLRAAADDDRARRNRAAPDAGVLARCTGAARADTSRDDVRHLRLGTADQAAHLVIEPAETGTPLPVLAGAPLTAPVRGTLGIAGAAAAIEALLRSLLLQLAVLPAGPDLRVLVEGGTPEVRLAARFLPRVSLLPTYAASGPLGAALPPHADGVLVVLPGPAVEGGREGDPPAVRYIEEALARGWPIIAPSHRLPAPAGALVSLGGSRATFSAQRTTTAFAPDLVPAAAFEAAARHAGSTAAARDDSGVPERCGLDEFVPTCPAGVSAAWTATAAAQGIVVPLGRSEAGPVTLDLVADGPHVLVAGTTGSGKSELLRSLVAAAAATHSPERVTFLFIDFKGGSGLGPLAGLPHCMGLVTDLADGGMDRTLASLRAELKHRERVLARARAADVVDYQRRGGVGLPRLVLVVDEFRMLVEDSPAALAELMRIATVGRALGMHLIMATQRPQGALSADIRANVATSIVLRMQHDAESSDVLGTPVAAQIPVGLPGRAFLAVGGGPPRAFQSASLGLASTVDSRVRIADAHDWPRPSPAGSSGTAPRTPAESAAPLLTATAQAWAAAGRRTLRKPVAHPLPRTVTVAEAASFGARAASAGTSPDGRQSTGAGKGSPVFLGMVDLPHEQRVAALTWDPARDGHLALVGPPQAGGADALLAVVGQLLSGSCPRHLYLLDGDGALAALREHPRVGAHVGVHELRRGARVIARLSEECALRLARGPGAAPAPQLVLVVSGWGGWVSALRQSPQAWAEEGLGDLVRDGAGAGLSVVVCGERELVASRIFGGLPARLFFPLGTTDEARLSWPRLPQMPRLRGRAAALGTIAPAGTLAAQCCLPAASDASFPEDRDGGAQGRRRREVAPFRIDPLPASAPAGLVAELAESEDGRGLPLPRGRLRLLVGLAGDEVRPLALGLGAGEVLLALGAPGSGKSTLLAALPAMNPGADFLAPAPDSRTAQWEAELERRTAARGTAAPTARTVLLVDDADRLDPAQNQLLAQLVEAGATVIATAGYSPSLYARCPLALTARSAGTGLLLAPRSANDGDAFGIRVDVPGRVPPGRAVALVEGQQIDVQLGWDGPGADALARRPLRRSRAPRHQGRPDRADRGGAMAPG